MSAAATPASASSPCATSTISDSTSRPSCLPNFVCDHPTMHPVIMLSTVARATIASRLAALYPDMGILRVSNMADSPETLTIRRPDDWHVHFRDGAMLRTVLPFTARQFARAIIMPNLVPPICDVAAARAYRERIIDALPGGVDFTPLMTCYLTDTSDADAVARGHAEGVFTAGKLFPAHSTTHSAHGVTSIDRVMPVLEGMAARGMPLLIHG